MPNDAQTSAVVFHTAQYVIEGSIALMPGARLTDYIRDSVDFIAVTEARVSGHDGVERFRVPFLDLRRDAIDLAYPAPEA